MRRPKFPKWDPQTPDITQEPHVGLLCVFSTLYFPLFSFFYIIKNSVLALLVPIYGFLETPQCPERTGNHNKVELPTYLWPYHLTRKVRAPPS